VRTTFKYLAILSAAMLGIVSWTTPTAGQDAQSLSAAEPEVPALREDAESEAGLQTYMGRPIAPPMHFSGAGWLVRSTRVEEENPARLLRTLELKPGQVVCDFGCGNGYHTLQLAKRVGPKGQVHATDIQQEMLDLLEERAAPRGLQNIKLVLAGEADAKAPASTFDLVLMVDVYHELSQPAEVLAQVRSSLKPQGRLAIVEFREEDPEVPIRPLHKMSQTQVMKELPANGFKLVGQFDGLPWQHVLFFARDDSPLAAKELIPWAGREVTP